MSTTTNHETLIDTVLDAYVECAVWSSHNWDNMDESDNPRPLDETHDADDIAPEALAEMRADVADLIEFVPDDTWDYWTTEEFGHDFWLTRNSHGAGFWDRYGGDQRGAELGRELTDLSKPYGSSDLYVGDDGKVYAS